MFVSPRVSSFVHVAVNVHVCTLTVWFGLIRGGKRNIRAVLRRQRGVFPGSSLTYRAFTCCNRHGIRYSHALVLLTSLDAFLNRNDMFASAVLIMIEPGADQSCGLQYTHHIFIVHRLILRCHEIVSYLSPAMCALGEDEP